MFSKVILICLVFSVKNLNGMIANHIPSSRLNFFDTDLLRYAVEDKPGNVMMSPASIKSVLAMILEGAKGRTEVEIKNALRLSPHKNEFREQLSHYLTSLQANTSNTLLENANAVFVSNKLNLKKEYSTMLRNVYLAEVNKVDFLNPVKAADAINSWVKNKTRGCITDMIEPTQVNPTTGLILTSGVYFRSTWLNSFNPKLTRRGCFFNKGACKDVAMMDLQAELNYAFVDDLRAHAIELPYEGKKYSMVLLVPQERDGLSGLVRDLPYMSLPQISAQMELNDVQLSMPKFTVEYDEDMVPVLQSMKINELFTAAANLSNIFENVSPQVNNIYHKVYLNVDEKGTVAAASTGAFVIPLIGSTVVLKVDRPFLFFIRDNESGVVIFEGKIESPNDFNEKQKG